MLRLVIISCSVSCCAKVEFVSTIRLETDIYFKASRYLGHKIARTPARAEFCSYLQLCWFKLVTTRFFLFRDFIVCVSYYIICNNGSLTVGNLMKRNKYFWMSMTPNLSKMVLVQTKIVILKQWKIYCHLGRLHVSEEILKLIKAETLSKVFWVRNIVKGDWTLNWKLFTKW